MDKQDFHRTILRMMRTPQAIINKSDVQEDKEKVSLSLNVDITSMGYASVTGQRLFVPLCPIRKEFNVPNNNKERNEELYIANGFMDESTITLTIPDGYSVESKPKNIAIEKPFGTFSFRFSLQENTVKVQYGLLLKKGIYDKSLFADFSDFIKQVSRTYSQKVALKRNL